MLEAQALVAAQSGKLDPYHQVETLGKLEIFDPTLSVNRNLACSYCHDPAAGYGERHLDLERVHRRIESGLGADHRTRSLSE